MQITPTTLFYSKKMSSTLEKILLVVAILIQQSICDNVNNLNAPVRVEVIDHNACPWTDTWTRKIEFPNNDVAKLSQNAQKGNCYQLGGNVSLYGTVQGELQMMLELSHDIAGDDYQRDTCVNYDKTTGCGGVGSWYVCVCVLCYISITLF